MVTPAAMFSLLDAATFSAGTAIQSVSKRALAIMHAAKGLPVTVPRFTGSLQVAHRANVA